MADENEPLIDLSKAEQPTNPAITKNSFNRQKGLMVMLTSLELLKSCATATATAASFVQRM